MNSLLFKDIFYSSEYLVYIMVYHISKALYGLFYAILNLYGSLF